MSMSMGETVDHVLISGTQGSEFWFLGLGGGCGGVLLLAVV